MVMSVVELQTFEKSKMPMTEHTCLPETPGSWRCWSPRLTRDQCNVVCDAVSHQQPVVELSGAGEPPSLNTVVASTFCITCSLLKLLTDVLYSRSLQ